MKRNLTRNLYFISGGLFGITSILNFVDDKVMTGITYICIAITCVSLGFSEKKNGK